MSSLYSPVLERAVRLAAVSHRNQHRRMSDVPYFSHPSCVALILSRAGFQSEAVLAAAILHDVVEDTAVTIEQIARDFPQKISEIVACCSERKRDANGTPRPWRQRKTEQIADMGSSSLECRAVLLADKLHNLSTMRFDQAAGISIWNHFNAPRGDVLWYLSEIVEAAAAFPDERLQQLADECRQRLDELRNAE